VQRIRTAEDQLDGIDPRLETCRKEAAEAAKQAEEAGKLAQQISELKTQASLADAGRNAAVAAANARRKLQKQSDALHQQIDKLRKQTDAAAASIKTAEDDFNTAKKVADAAAKKQTAATAAVAQAERDQRRGDLVRRVEVAAKNAELAQKAADDLSEARQKHDAIKVDAEALKDLRAAHGNWRSAKARLDGAAATISITPVTGISVDGQALSAGKQRDWNCVAPTDISIDGVAEIRILPGGEGLLSQSESVAELKSALDAAMAELYVDSLEQAEHLERERAGYDTEIQRLKATSSALAPDGIDELQRSLARQQEELADLGDAAGDGDLDTARKAQATAQAELDAARENRDTVQGRFAALERESGRIQGEINTSEPTLARLTDELGAMPDQDALDAEQKTAEDALKAAQSAHADAAARYTAIDGDAAQRAKARTERALHNVEHEKTALIAERSTLRGELETFEGQDLHEQIQEQEAETERLATELARIRRQANAAGHLRTVLANARSSAMGRLMAPVTDKVSGWLVHIFPGTNLKLNDKWEIEGLDNGMLTEGFDDLSGGAREQVSVLTRLALGHIFAGDDRLPVVLDDALVNSDPDRHKLMLDVLDRAADHLQIIVFSCHAQAHDPLGADRVYKLESLRDR
jgi:hypothetical protein